VGAIAVRAFAEGNPQEAAKMMILLTVFGFIGRLSSRSSRMDGPAQRGRLLASARVS